MAKAFIGTSGWVYDDWWGRFYPPNLKPEERLEHYAKSFDTVELNASFYHLPRKKTFENWAKKTPREFVFAVKISKYITQNLKLKNALAPTKLFLQEASGLGNKLSVVLVQLPPNFGANKERLENFLKVLSNGFGLTTATFQTCAPTESGSPRLLIKATKNSEERMESGLAQTGEKTAGSQNLIRLPRFAFEFRHESWLNEEIYGLLRKYSAGFVIQDSVHWPTAEVVTSGFVYLRFHGPGALYSSNYPDPQLKRWAEKIKKWLSEGLDVYGYFNNDVNAFAVHNALKLRDLVSKA
ncbi:MAG: hypothetical protein A2126_00400 [Candidatus Woykebacteria bacterium GWB1_45_5]|uniref:DUF72 domain-containing protein n=2 Tax=Candidatus Woykeibacteriota TaxID=1817899 RepID=A0A1G1W4M7_9BACT|nr:MAG: hypothetical protein A2113_04530 [Candidatus Woykebacteria bacterium GWA1_44_8]OGY24543.1 MAG: hypothetical protein A2126_00400 [Candidatus Woykebacteria bacterium GWB1_45_5]